MGSLIHAVAAIGGLLSAAFTIASGALPGLVLVVVVTVVLFGFGTLVTEVQTISHVVQRWAARNL